MNPSINPSWSQDETRPQREIQILEQREKSKQTSNY